MLKLHEKGLTDRAGWSAAGVALPAFDHAAMAKKTLAAPRWLHFGAGNIFRGYIARLAHGLIEAGEMDTGIIAAESFDFDIIDQIYTPHDSLTLLVTLLPNGSTRREVVAGIAAGYRTDRDMETLRKAFRDPGLQMVSFTITEKGYALRDLKGDLTPAAQADMAAGPAGAKLLMALVTGLLMDRYWAGGAPIAMVSMDNCSHNGDKLRAAVLEMAKAWAKKGHADSGFAAWLETKVSFPWSMIDKITTRPDATVEEKLTADGIGGMAPIITSRNTYIAPFVNAEAPKYLVVEDDFPGGRPPLEKAGVYFTDRDTVNNTERMKVTTCLNPLHTALAVLGCLLGYTSIAAEMKDADLKALVELIGYREGMPVVVNPGIIDPEDFLKEVLRERFPNPFIHDTPQRIATDTSQKLAIRFGETIKSYMERPGLDPKTLTGIPLVQAAWFRYLLGVDDDMNPMELSGDPMLEELQKGLMGIRAGEPKSYSGQLAPFLHSSALFGVDLYEAGLADKVEALFVRMLAGKGAVRSTLKECLEEGKAV